MNNFFNKSKKMNKQYIDTHNKRFKMSIHYLAANGILQDGMRVLNIGQCDYWRDMFCSVKKDIDFTEFTGDIRLPTDNNNYDLVLCMEVIEHLKDLELPVGESGFDTFTGSGIKGMLQNCQKLLIPGGHLFISTPNTHCYRTMYNWVMGSDLFTYAPHPRELSWAYMRDVISRYFDIVHTECFSNWGCHGTPELFMKSMEKWLLDNGHSIQDRDKGNRFILCKNDGRKI